MFRPTNCRHHVVLQIQKKKCPSLHKKCMLYVCLTTRERIKQPISSFVYLCRVASTDEAWACAFVALFTHALFSEVLAVNSRSRRLLSLHCREERRRWRKEDKNDDDEEEESAQSCAGSKIKSCYSSCVLQCYVLRYKSK